MDQLDKLYEAIYLDVLTQDYTCIPCRTKEAAVKIQAHKQARRFTIICDKCNKIIQVRGY